MKIFITGHQGYIGVHLVEWLKKAGHHVTGCDLGLFEGCEFNAVTPADVAVRKDIRDLDERDLDGFDAVMHLAAISNDPMGDLDPGLTESVNRDGSIHLAEVAKRAGVPRFLFSSSCSIYGKGEKMDLAEDDLLSPVSVYAQSKIDTEKAVGKMADKNFAPTFLRNATAYGYSPMLRIDLVANNLLACALTRGDIRIMSDGSPWRPLIHCRDIARAFVAFMNAPVEKVRGLAVNVGGDRENYQVKDVGDAVQKLVPAAKIVYTGEVGADPRNYRVDFARLSKTLPDFQLKYNLQSGCEEMFRYMRDLKFSLADFEGDRYVRLRTLKSGRLGLLQRTGAQR